MSSQDPGAVQLRVAAALLRLLADGKPHLRAELERVSSAEKSQLDAALALLIRYQVPVSLADDIYIVPGGLELLSEDAIRATMDAPAALVALDVRLLVDSTNARLLSANSGGGPCACLAEGQFSGRGRGGNDWVSPLAANLYLSLRWQLACERRPPPMTTLAAGAAVAQAIALRTGVEIALKWPNDLTWRRRKLGGLLVEHRLVGSISEIVIGVGINVSMPRSQTVAIDQPWVDLGEACGHDRVSRNTLAGAVIAQLVDTMVELDAGNTECWRERWQRLDAVRDQQVRLRMADGRNVCGVAKGVASDGALLLESGGTTRAYHAGEVSLRVVG